MEGLRKFANQINASKFLLSLLSVSLLSNMQKPSWCLAVITGYLIPKRAWRQHYVRSITFVVVGILF